MSPLVNACLGVVLSLFIVVGDAQVLKAGAYDTTPQLIAAAGYPVEKHRARTEDGYILQLHRIPAGRRSARRTSAGGKGKRAVLLTHGLLGSSGDFVLMGPDRSLAYMLADAGYDVWMANLRGNAYTAHQTLKKTDAQFWDYSFHEHGKYDLPATIDKILNVTGLDKIMYVGYSMGTTSFFSMVAQRPEYNDKIVAFVAMAPAVYMDNIREVATFFLKTLNPSTMKSEGIYYFTIPSDVREAMINGICNARRSEQDVCLRFIYGFVGEDYEQNDWDISPLMMARFQPASWGQLEHFGKVALTGVFTSFDGGLSTPPKPYDLKNVKVPVLLLYGENDQLTHKSQVARLARELNSTGVLEDMKPGCLWPKLNHLDFTFARDVGKMINKPLLHSIQQLYNKYDP
ncbi:lipase 1 [Plutella xylostella]|uniref:lipase 1 n=1 Tax=Plutella xylostella TaxID=51655 RepID=UPI0020322A48|nr:lipase 1 [Plutella xylostella]